MYTNCGDRYCVPLFWLIYKRHRTVVYGLFSNMGVKLKARKFNQYSRCTSCLLVLALVFTAAALQSCERFGQSVSGLGEAFGAGSDQVEENPESPDRDNTPIVLEDKPSGEKTFSGDGATVDYSNAGDGYVMVRYKGSNNKVKVQIAYDGGPKYTYDLRTDGAYEAFPLTQGKGSYTIGVFLNLQDDRYLQAVQKEITANIDDEFAPFLRPNQFVNYTEKNKAISKAEDLSKGAKSDLGAIKNMYDFVIGNVTYDYDKAKTVKSGYLPSIDETLYTGKGICFDYASLMTAMFRSQGIPTKLVVGFADQAYHAWITCYVDGEGWIVKIHFDGAKWYFMDPTFAAGGNEVDPNLIGSGTNYNPVYYY